MNSLSNLPPTGLLLRLRVIGQEKGGRPFPQGFFLFPPPQGAKCRQVRVTAWGGSFIPDGKGQAEPKTGHFQDGPAGGASALQWKKPFAKQRGLTQEGSKKAHILPLITISLSGGAGSRCSQAVSISNFPYCKSWELQVLRSKVAYWKEKCSAAFSHKAMCPSLSVNSLFYHHLPCLPHFFSFIYNTTYTHPHNHTFNENE